jgi:hypothetical protein
MRNIARQGAVPEQDSAPLRGLPRARGGEPMEAGRSARFPGAMIRPEPKLQRRPGLY